MFFHFHFYFIRDWNKELIRSTVERCDGQRWVQSVRPSGVAVVTVVGGTLTSHPFGAGVAKYESRCIQWYLNNVWEHHYGDWELMDRLIVWLAATLAAPPLPCVISTTLHTERHITSYTSHLSPFLPQYIIQIYYWWVTHRL